LGQLRSEGINAQLFNAKCYFSNKKYWLGLGKGGGWL